MRFFHIRLDHGILLFLLFNMHLTLLFLNHFYFFSQRRIISYCCISFDSISETLVCFSTCNYYWYNIIFLLRKNMSLVFYATGISKLYRLLPSLWLHYVIFQCVLPTAIATNVTCFLSGVEYGLQSSTQLEIANCIGWVHVETTFVAIQPSMSSIDLRLWIDFCNH